MSKWCDAERHTRPPAVDDALEHRSVIAALAAAGIAGPIMFARVALVQSLLRPEHSLVADPISALAAGPSGWVQDVNFLVFGALMVAYAIGLHLGVPPDPMGRGRTRVPGAQWGRACVGEVVSLNRCHRRQMGRSGSAHRGLPYDVPGRRDRAHRSKLWQGVA